jgi:hypothetical protein
MQWTKALEPNITDWIHDGFKSHSDWTAQLLNIESNGGFTRIQDSWGPRLVSKSGEAAATPAATRQLGYETVAANQIFKEKIEVSEEYVNRGLYAEIKKDAQDLGKAGIETINLFGAQPFIEGFTSTNIFYGDAKPLFSVSHTRPDGGTANSNASATSIAFTEGNLETALIAVKQQKGGTGQKLAIGSNLLLQVQESQEKEAVIITGSQRRSGTTNNDLNFYLGKVDTFVNPYIGSDITDLNGVAGSDTAWSLLARGEHKVTLSYEMRPRFTTWDDEDADAMYTKIKFSCWNGWKSFYGTWGSQGSAAAYSS